MAASCDGSVLMDASAMAEAMVLILSISGLLLLPGDAKTGRAKLDPEPGPCWWAESAGELPRSWRREVMERAMRCATSLGWIFIVEKLSNSKPQTYLLCARLRISIAFG